MYFTVATFVKYHFSLMLLSLSTPTPLLGLLLPPLTLSPSLIPDRGFFCEARAGVVSDLLFRVLKDSKDDAVLGGLVEEFLWCSWSVHDNDQVVRLMSEAVKLSNAEQFERSNAALNKVKCTCAKEL